MTFQRVQRELSAEEIARLRELRAGGKRLKWLAHEFGISHQTVSRYLRARRVGLAEELPEEWAEAVRTAEVPSGAKPPLPAWNLGGAGELHRRDIYDDSEER